MIQGKEEFLKCETVSKKSKNLTRSKFKWLYTQNWETNDKEKTLAIYLGKD